MFCVHSAALYRIFRPPWQSRPLIPSKKAILPLNECHNGESAAICEGGGILHNTKERGPQWISYRLISEWSNCWQFICCSRKESQSWSQNFSFPSIEETRSRNAEHRLCVSDCWLLIMASVDQGKECWLKTKRNSRFWLNKQAFIATLFLSTWFNMKPTGHKNP